jgi:hypothetical protein
MTTTQNNNINKSQVISYFLYAVGCPSSSRFNGQSVTNVETTKNNTTQQWKCEHLLFDGRASATSADKRDALESC